MVPFLIILIILLQALTVYLDNKTCMIDFFELVKNKKIAKAFNKRGMLLTISRTIFFTIPPLIGYLLTYINEDQLLVLTCIVLALNFSITAMQGYFYNKEWSKYFFSIEIQRELFSSIIFLTGVLAFIFFLTTPYILNFLALKNNEHGLWIVQLNNILNSIFVLYLVFIFDPMVSKKIDNNENLFLDQIHAFYARLYGRLIGLIIFIFFIF